MREIPTSRAGNPDPKLARRQIIGVLELRYFVAEGVVELPSSRDMHVFGAAPDR